MQKIWLNKILNTFIPWDNLSSFSSSRDMIVPQEKKV
jgi:hypothetical protein